MDGDAGESAIVDRQCDDAEVHGTCQHGFQHLARFRTLHRDADIGITCLEFGKNLGKDMETSSFIGSDDDFSAGNVGTVGKVGDHFASSIERILDILQKDTSCVGECDAASASIEQAGSDFVLNGADLRTDCRLCTETPLCRTRKALVARYFEESLEVIEIHEWFSVPSFRFPELRR